MGGANAEPIASVEAGPTEHKQRTWALPLCPQSQCKDNCVEMKTGHVTDSWLPSAGTDSEEIESSGIKEHLPGFWRTYRVTVRGGLVSGITLGRVQRDCAP